MAQFQARYRHLLGLLDYQQSCEREEKSRTFLGLHSLYSDSEQSVPEGYDDSVALDFIGVGRCLDFCLGVDGEASVPTVRFGNRGRVGVVGSLLVVAASTIGGMNSPRLGLYRVR